jgi:hypothetical protein
MTEERSAQVWASIQGQSGRAVVVLATSVGSQSRLERSERGLECLRTAASSINTLTEACADYARDCGNAGIPLPRRVSAFDAEAGFLSGGLVLPGGLRLSGG